MLNKVSKCMLQSAMRSRSVLGAAASRTYLADLGLDSNAIQTRIDENKVPGAMALWKDQAESQKNALVLSSEDEIEAYVLSLVRDYFRTTKKASVTMDSLFRDHGLDSLDAIEFVIRIEDELGYLIDAENLDKF